MKRLLILGALLFGAVCATAAGDVDYTVDRTRHDFGKLAAGNTYTTTFTVTATGDAPLVLVDAQTGCKCTKAAFPKKPLRKGETVTVTVTFEAIEGGFFEKQIVVRTNAPEPVRNLKFRVTGVVKK